MSLIIDLETFMYFTIDIASELEAAIIADSKDVNHTIMVGQAVGKFF